ncbi:MAG: porin family protein [Gammaproteobacteria bacterium]|nr:porin family protein [Gammaproteobacteria bacterium]MDH5801364.1 porin family protein [Gammaproteobacteria bacterium]
MKLIKMKGWVLILLFLSSPIMAAGNNSRPYIELDYVRNTVDIYGTEFKPKMTKLKGGYYFWDKIALELQYYDSGNDSVGGRDLEIEKMIGYFLRLDSDVQNRVRIYVLAGQIETRLVYTGVTSDSIDTQDIAFAIGAEEKLQAYQNAYITIEYGRLMSDEVINIKELSLGIRFDF